MRQKLVNGLDPANCVLPLSLPVLADAEGARERLEAIRWAGGRVCVRCGSDRANPLNSNIFRGMFRCAECNYMFNAASGTVLQGTKLPVCKFLQFFVILDCMGEAAEPRDLVYALDVTYKTAMAVKRKWAGVPAGEPYAIRDRALFRSLRQAGPASPVPAGSERFQIYAEANGILVEPAAFERRIAGILAHKVPVGRMRGGGGAAGG